MKTRTSFISNSSSASFIVPLKDISEEQLCLIRNYKTAILCISENRKEALCHIKSWDYWSIKETDEHIAGTTAIDNIDMINLFSFLGLEKYFFNDTYIALSHDLGEQLDDLIDRR